MTLKRRTPEETVTYFSAKIAEQDKRIRELEADKARLDWLESDDSFSTTNWRVNSASMGSLRQAIDNAKEVQG